MTIREQSLLEPKLFLPEINDYNDTPLFGEIILRDKFKWVHFRQEFQTRLMRKTLHDFLSECYEDKIKNRGWYVSITLF